MRELNTIDVGITEYTDIKNRTHSVRHSVIFTDIEKQELESKIVDDLYRIFNS